MADILKTITLTSLGSNAGPLFDVYYSLDCISYTQSVDGNDVSLPFVGSSVNVTIPDTTTCIKLVNLSDVCGLNEYVEFIGAGTTTTTSTTSTTTTIAPTTSTTTTTVAPTTTTTTTTAPIVEYWSASYCSNGAQVPIILKATSSLSSGNVVNWGSDTSTCATLTNVYVGSPFIYLTINRLYTNCFDCQGITTTTTSTTSTTTTTTLGPSYCWKIVNTTGGSLTLEYYNTINEPVIIGVPGGSTDYICAYGGTTPTGDAGLTIEACGTQCTSSDSCTGCTPPTTTTTSTTSTTTTTTLAPVNGTTSFTCNDTPYGETPTATVSINTLTGGSGVYQVTNTLYLSEAGALGGTYIDAGTLPIDYFAVENNTWWVGIRDKNNTTNKIAKQIVVSCSAGTTTTTTLAPTTTTTSTTSTTTTTAAPTTYLVEPCGGGLGPYIVTLASGDTPSGIGQAYKISGNSGAGFNGTTCWEVLEVNPVGSIDYSNLAFGSVFSNCAECNPTTTTTTTAAPTTTTTTTAAPGVQFGVSISTKYATDSLACAGTVTGVVYQPPIYGTTPSNGAQLYTDSAMTTTWTPSAGAGIYLFQYGGTTKWAVFVGSSGVISGVTACSGLTTTSTSTTTTTAGATATLDWSFTETAANGTMDIYVNGSNVISASSTTSGTWTGLVAGDEIYYDLNVTGCTGGNNFANAYSTGIIVDASCDESVTFISSAVYTVQPGDIGTTISLDLYALCDSACV